MTICHYTQCMDRIFNKPFKYLFHVRVFRKKTVYTCYVIMLILNFFSVLFIHNKSKTLFPNLGFSCDSCTDRFINIMLKIYQIKFVDILPLNHILLLRCSLLVVSEFDLLCDTSFFSGNKTFASLYTYTLSFP